MILTLVGVLLLAAACGPAAAETGPVVDSLSSFIEHEMTTKNIPALSIALVDADETVWATGFGLADTESGLAATAGTVYRVGSVSKLFTDIAVMQLVERSELDLDAPLAEYVPELSFARDVTLRQLMSHRAGMIREPPVGNYFDPSEPTLEATVESLDGIPLVYEPESRTKYSNAGIALVGYVLERTQGAPFTDYIKKNILSPFGMSHSSFVPPPEVATGTMWTYDGRVFEAPTFQLGMAPAGSLYATVDDLARFMSALFRGGDGVISPRTLASMFEPQFRYRDPSASYGLGFSIGELDGARLVRHGGAIYGFSTELAFLPEEKLGVVAVASKDFTNAVVERIVRHALRCLEAAKSGRPLPRAETTSPLPSGKARELAGRYPDFRLLARGDRLFLEEKAKVVEVRMRGGELVVDSPITYGRVVDADPRARLEEVLPDEAPRRFRPLIGEYGWDHNTLYILEKDGALHALIEWFESYPLTELSPDRFAFPDYGLYQGEELRFEDGAVVAAHVRFERRDVGASEGQTFRIRPLRPTEEVRREALAASPPEEEGDFLDPDLIEPVRLDSTMRLDVRYATTNNFMGAVFYDEPKAFLQRPAAEALVRAHRALEAKGYGILIHDAYRPWYVTKMFWDATPEELRIFVADPSSGSRHNRGAAADLTLFDRKTGEPVVMVGGYDEFSPRSFPDYPGGTTRQRYLRELLRGEMEAEGFEVYEFEWWHFDFGDWRKYPILNRSFDELSQ
ncbi:MAG TPA: serine hydrolase [Vicinamibacteria bacterium]|nr:serine hydrolase [Vicinamibacteria bacterium]